MKKTQLIFAGIASLLFSNAFILSGETKRMGCKSLWFCKSRLYFRFETVCTSERIPSQPLSFRQKLDANGDDINATGASNFYQ